MKKWMVLSGRFKKGLDRGRYFVSIKEYKKQFIKKLKIDPYPGTLNIELSGANITKYRKIKRTRGILIKGFRKGGRSFGNVVGYPASMSGIKCALITPHRTTHTKVAEIISKKHLVKSLRLKFGDRVKVTVYR